jgi:hypothetical protein
MGLFCPAGSRACDTIDLYCVKFAIRRQSIQEELLVDIVPVVEYEVCMFNNETVKETKYPPIHS